VVIGGATERPDRRQARVGVGERAAGVALPGPARGQALRLILNLRGGPCLSRSILTANECYTVAVWGARWNEVGAAWVQGGKERTE
jgi:hypothetical protein